MLQSGPVCFPALPFSSLIKCTIRHNACMCLPQLMVWDPDVNKAIAHVLEIEKDIQEHIKIT